MKKLITICAIIAIGAMAMPSVGTVVSYTNEASFTTQLQSGYYLENFDYAPWLTITDPAISSPQLFAGNGWAYQISSPAGLSGQPIPPPDGPGGAVANYQQGQAVTVTFTGTLPDAVGGIFFVTDLTGNAISGGAVSITLASGGTFTYTDTSDWDAFTGFISDSPIASMTLSSGNFSTMDHLYVGVPEPATICLLGLGTLSLIRRKR